MISTKSLFWCALLGWGWATSPASAVTLTRGPYVQMTHFATSAVVVWRTDSWSDSWVDYGLTPAYGSTASGASGWQHEVTLMGLQPGTAYYYRVRSAGVNLATGVLLSGKSPGQPFRLATFSDSHMAGAGGIGQRMALLKPDLILAAGDLTDNGLFAELDANVFTKFGEVLRSAPLYWTPGNHDVANDFAVCREAFVLPSDERNYWFEYGDAQVVSLNSEGLPGTAWLAGVLAGSGKPWKIVFFHRAARSSSGGHGEYAEIRDQYVPVMEQYGVQLVLAGHNHYYWRSVPINGITHLVQGVSGNRLREVGAMPCYSAAGISATNYPVPGAVTRSFSVADVDGRYLHLRGIAENGTVLDETLLDLDCPFQLDGLLDASATLVASRSGGLSLWAAVAGRYLYVATQDAGEGNDHFVFLSRELTARMTNLWSWSKTGSVMEYEAFLADENDNLYNAWFYYDGYPIGELRVARSVSRWCNGAYTEGVIDLQQFCGTIPPVLYLAAAPYGTANGGTLVAAQQCPAGNGDGTLDPAEFAAVPTASILVPFIMNGLVDSPAYEIADRAGMKLWAAVHSNTLYVATWAAGNAGGPNDHFIFVTDAPGPLTNAPWAKAGLVAFDPATKPYLADESANNFVGWFNGGAAARSAAAATGSGHLEGSINLAQVFGAVPETLYLAVAPYATADGGALVAGSQVPAGNGNGHVEATEFLAVSLAAIRDENLDGLHDGPPGPPATPTQVVATAVSHERIDVSWAAVAGATAYIIRRGGSPIAVTSATNYSNTGLSPSTFYCYTVTATNAAGSSAESAPACVTTHAPPPPPPTPTNLTAAAVNFRRIDLSWEASSGASGYLVRRDGVLLAATASPGYADTNLTAETTYCYTVAATNSAGVSAPSAPACATTPLGPPLVMDGAVDYPAYEIADNNGMKLWAAVRSNTLYVATWAAGNAGGPNDHFIFVSDVVGVVTSAPWAKAGTVAFPRRSKAYLADESLNSFVSWYTGGVVAASIPCAAAATGAGHLEGAIDLVAVFGAVPETLYLAVAPYATADGGALVAGSQVPAGNGDGNVDAHEFVAVPVAAIRDHNQDGVFDVLDSRRGFAVKSDTEPGAYLLRWPSIPGRRYRVQYTDNLFQPFANLSDELTAAQGQFNMSHADASAPGVPRRFYRVRLVDP